MRLKIRCPVHKKIQLYVKIQADNSRRVICDTCKEQHLLLDRATLRKRSAAYRTLVAAGVLK